MKLVISKNGIRYVITKKIKLNKLNKRDKRMKNVKLRKSWIIKEKIEVFLEQDIQT